MEKALVTGGAGFIGSHLTDLLIERGCEVAVVDSLEPQVHSQLPDYLNPRARYFFDRVGSERLVYEDLLQDVDTVFYLASKVGPVQSMTDIADYTRCNINDLGRLLEAMLKYGTRVKRIVLSGSMGPYGEGRYECCSCGVTFYPDLRRTGFEYSCGECGGAARNLPLDEATSINNISFYGLSKNVQESMLLLFAQANSVEFVSVRYFSVYGPRQALNNPYAGPIPIWFGAAVEGEPIVVYEDGNQTRDFIHVSDVSEITYRAGTYSLPSGVQILNCGTGVASRILDVAQFIKECTGSNSEITVTRSIRPGDLRHSLCDNSRLRELLQFDSFRDLRSGLGELMPYVVRQIEREKSLQSER